MITLRSSETDKEMLLTIKDHKPLKTLYTAAALNNQKKVIYIRLGETIVADMENVFNALIALDKEEFEKKDWAEKQKKAREAEGIL